MEKSAILLPIGVSPLTSSCYSPEDIGVVANLAPGDARRVHLEECPRCQALLAAYREFMRADLKLPGADPVGARRRLGDFLSREILADEPDAAGPGRRIAGTEAGDWLSKVRSLLGIRSLLVAASLALLAGVAYVSLSPRAPSEMRGDGTPRGSREVIEVVEASWGAEGALNLEWRPVAEVDGYQVEFLDARLSPLSKLPRTVATRLTLGRSELPSAAVSGGRIYWRVIGLQGGKESVSSDPRILTIP